MDKISVLMTMIPALPLVAALLCALAGPRLLRQYCHVPVILCLAGSFAGSFLLFLEVRSVPSNLAENASAVAGFERVVTLWSWANVEDALPDSGAASTNEGERAGGDFRIDIVLRADALTAMMLCMVTFISTFIALYSAGYMHGDRGYWRFFAYLSLFVFSMAMLVSVSNFLLLYVFWEAVGVCSYLLIGYWYEKPEAAAAGMKAFLVNRIGDVGFALGLFLIWTTYGTLNFHDTTRGGLPLDSLSSQVTSGPGAGDPSRHDEVVRGVLSPARIAAHGYVAGGVGLAICLLLMLGACGKSAQFPLHVWLPDAMEGPTPVSALIHAATMVTAGVYMVARCTPLFMVSPAAQLVVALIGGFTALIAALIALTQYDLKRVLAYSTISQLGYMFLGLGTGMFLGITAGLFHLFTHAFFKALLFLGAGSVMHAMGNVIDMRRFSGLRHRLPITYATFLIGCCALAGLPPFSGFWSKDSIIAAVEERAHELAHEGEAAHREAAGDGQIETVSAAGFTPHQAAQAATVYRWLYYLAVATGLLTAFYTFRAFYMTFYGPEVIPEEAGDHAHESPPVMWWPLAVLAIGAAVAGFSLDLTYTTQPTHLFAEFLASTPSLAGGIVAETRTPYTFHMAVAGVSVAAAAIGVLLATYLYLGDTREVRWLKSLFDFQEFSRWYDELPRTAWSRVGWVSAVHRGASSIGLGWLTLLIGQILLLALFVLASPLLLGNFLSPYKLSFHKFFLDELYYYTLVAPLQLIAQLCYAADRWIVDGLVNSFGKLATGFGALMRSLQMGLIQFYALAMFLGVLVLIATRLLMAAG